MILDERGQNITIPSIIVTVVTRSFPEELILAHNLIKPILIPASGKILGIHARLIVIVPFRVRIRVRRVTQMLLPEYRDLVDRIHRQILITDRGLKLDRA